MYRWKTKASGWLGAWADTGRVASFDAQSLAPEASRWFGGGVAVRYDGAFEDQSQWSYFTAARDHYPLQKFSTTGWMPRAVFFSSRTGEVIVATSFATRLPYYLGPGLHYFSFYPIRNNDPLWRGLVNWTSGAGAVTCFIGIVIGVWQLRWRAIGTRRRVIPYARRWMRWHHWTGLGFGLITFTFVLSGLFSMNPAGIFASTEVPATLRTAFLGRRSPLDAQPSPAQAFAAALPSWQTREFEWKRLRGRPYVLASDNQSTQHLLLPHSAGLTTRPAFTDAELLAFVADLLPARVDSVQRLGEFDDFYYARKDRYLPLPVVRVRRQDSRSTWYYLEPASGQLFLKSDEGTRVRRWAYNGLHSLDPQFLLRRGVLWDAAIWIVSLCGLALSVTGCVVAWLWLQKSGWLFARRRRAPQIASKTDGRFDNRTAGATFH